ncbi:cupin domain-containing protein [Antarctobacter sp.]|uniref:cupin domain-containing protein n=1 Tax=Antarctobacter sp. TaxID=1872577 RepID=UPI003A902D65
MSQTTPHDSLVARRLRVVRQAHGLSQRELARRTGVGSGTISQIESMATQPSVSVLKKILDGIPMDLATFFSFEMMAAESPVFRKEEHVDIGAPGLKYLLLAAARPNRHLQMLHEFYQPGSGSGRRALSHDGEECAIVISGRLEVTVGDQTYVLERGDGYYFSSSTPHRFHNPGPQVCEVVSSCTPATF